MPSNRQVLLASRPAGFPTEANFKLVETPVPVPADGQFLVRNHWLSLDPYMRGRMDAVKSYAKYVELGEVMTGGAVGEIPFVECWPELWVRQPGDALRARGLIDQVLSPGAQGEPWTCPGCGERIEPQFAQCWHCAAAAPSPEALR